MASTSVPSWVLTPWSFKAHFILVIQGLFALLPIHSMASFFLQFLLSFLRKVFLAFKFSHVKKKCACVRMHTHTQHTHTHWFWHSIWSELTVPCFLFSNFQSLTIFLLTNMTSWSCHWLRPYLSYFWYQPSVVGYSSSLRVLEVFHLATWKVRNKPLFSKIPQHIWLFLKTFCL